MKIVTFLWKKVETAFNFPSPRGYTHQHVNILQSMLKRHLDIDHELICITDMPEGVNCRTIPLWDKCKSLGGCYNRLYVFSRDMKELIGDRFAVMDMDCVVTGDVTPIFTRTEPFLMHRYTAEFTQQKVNGSLVIMDAGVHDHVWTSFDPIESPKIIAIETEAKRRVGSDQAWISLNTQNVATLGNEDGIYETRVIRGSLPVDARLVFFSGRRDPSTSDYAWVKELYR